MKVLEIQNINEFGVCLLIDTNDETKYEIVLDFYNMKKPQVKDKITLAECLIDERSPFYSKSLYFEPSKDLSVEDFKNLLDKEYAKIERKGKCLVLRRVYG